MRKYLNARHGKAREAIIDLVKLKKSLTTAVLSSCITGDLAERRSQFYANIGQCSHVRMCSRVMQSNCTFGRKGSNVTAFETLASSAGKKWVAPDDVNGTFASWALS